jgi:hypothetical protein
MNNLMNTNIQKGFVSGCDGVLEHSELLDHVMHSAKRAQRSLFVTLFDLRNAFGEINHNLIRSSLEYHHSPLLFLDIFNSIYANFTVTICCNNKNTEPIHVQKGVLQGDPCSPLLFNICFNALIKILDSDKYKQMGYIWGSKSSQCCNWLQYADDAAIVASSQKNAQGLTNLFEAWCKWASMEIRIDKCNVFGMVKKGSTITQILPRISISTGDIPPVPIGGHFKYLGRNFDFDLRNELVKSELVDKVEKYLKIISSLKLKPQTKIKIIDHYVFAQISFTLRIYNLSVTWVSENIDTLFVRYVRNWLEAPISSCVAECLNTPINKCGLGVPSFKNKLERLKLSKRSALKNSKHENINLLFSETSPNYVNQDSILLNSTFKEAHSTLIKKQENEAVQHFLGLDYQGKSAKTIIGALTSKSIDHWSKTVDNVPGYLFNFARKALQSQLPTLANLHRWGKSATNTCPLCGAVQTNKYVLTNCSNQIVLARFLSRHNKILELLANWFSVHISNDSKLFVDLPNSSYMQTLDLFNNLRPDLAILCNDVVHVVELTVCHETNLESSKAYKADKYKNLNNHKSECIKDFKVVVHTCELSVLGFLHIDADLFKSIKTPKFDDALVTQLIKSSIRSSYDIYVRRNSLD